MPLSEYSSIYTETVFEFLRPCIAPYFQTTSRRTLGRRKFRNLLCAGKACFQGFRGFVLLVVLGCSETVSCSRYLFEFAMFSLIARSESQKNDDPTKGAAVQGFSVVLGAV